MWIVKGFNGPQAPRLSRHLNGTKQCVGSGHTVTPDKIIRVVR